MATRNNLCASVGEWVLLNTSDERQLMVQATLSGKVRLSKKKSCSTAPLVGARFGSVFELVGRDLTPVEGDLLLDLTSSAAEATASASSTEATAAGQQSTTDNRELVDDNSAQTLPPEELSLALVDDATIVADARLIQTYNPKPGRQVKCSLSSLFASNDVLYRDSAVMRKWEELTSGRSQFVELEGTHM